MKKNEGKQWPNENKHLKEKRNTGRKETIKGKETPVLEGKTPEGERHFFMYCTTPSLTWGDFSDQGLSQLLFLIF